MGTPIKPLASNVPAMASQSPKILITGLPGCGKTTAVVRIMENLDRTKVAGFYTQEIRENDTRKGFSWNRLDGTAGVLAHVEINGPFKVGKYSVDVAGFEKDIVPALDAGRTDAQLFVVDEIGKMECFSERFVTVVCTLFASDKSVLATVARKGGGLISEVKSFPGTRLFNLTRENRDETVAEVSNILSFLKGAS